MAKQDSTLSNILDCEFADDLFWKRKGDFAALVHVANHNKYVTLSVYCQPILSRPTWCTCDLPLTFLPCCLRFGQPHLELGTTMEWTLLQQEMNKIVHKIGDVTTNTIIPQVFEGCQLRTEYTFYHKSQDAAYNTHHPNLCLCEYSLKGNVSCYEVCPAQITVSSAGDPTSICWPVNPDKYDATMKWVSDVAIRPLPVYNQAVQLMNPCWSNEILVGKLVKVNFTLYAERCNNPTVHKRTVAYGRRSGPSYDHLEHNGNRHHMALRLHCTEHPKLEQNVPSLYSVHREAAACYAGATLPARLYHTTTPQDRHIHRTAASYLSLLSLHISNKKAHLFMMTWEHPACPPYGTAVSSTSITEFFAENAASRMVDPSFPNPRMTYGGSDAHIAIIFYEQRKSDIPHSTLTSLFLQHPVS
ncbi:hypothetical protein M422DRAFT_254627 [Sphaerobolus stellatus SS14]|uniref:Uncharacterized protein n=1 Tax=Sphaerobolus stellatus (strain SS14) TaxID=990650 RepID=A0A0C9UGL6_SPHS4|nr:hypothetical protein M422DRAFT_254627 [Sphaerobolus stellatus SS14]